jgi:bifunctional DNase/RNase
VGLDDEFLKQVNEHFRQKGPGEQGEEATPEEIEARGQRELNEKEVRVVGVCQAPHGGAFVLLRDSLGRNLPIWIDESQALSIHLALEGNSPARPMTHDLLKLLVERLGGSVESILVDDLYNSVYYAKIELRQGERSQQIDCRPSDAIAVAVRYKVPIYVADHVLEEGQVPITEE